MNEPNAPKEMNLRGKVGQQIDFLFSALKEMSAVTERIAGKTYGWARPPEEEAKDADCPPGFLNEFIDRLKIAEKKAKLIIALLHETDNQL